MHEIVLISSLWSLDLASLREYRTYIGLDQPTLIIIDPNEGDLDDQRHRILHQRWSEVAGAGTLPTLKALLDARMSALRDFLMVLGATEDGKDFRYLAYGAALTAATGTDMTGMTTRSLPTALANVMTDIYSEAVSRHRPVYSRVYPPADERVERWDRLIVPLQERPGPAADTLFVVGIPTGVRARAGQSL